MPPRLKRWAVLAAIAVLVSALYSQIDALKFSSHRWLPDDNPAYQNKHYLNDEFNRGEHLFVVVRLQQNYFDAELLSELDQIVQQLEEIDLVGSVNSPLHATTFIQDTENTLHSVSFKQAMDRGLISASQYPDKLADSRYVDRLIDRQGRIIVIQLTLDLDLGQDNSLIRAGIFSQIEKLLQTSARFADYGFAGEAELAHRIDSLSQDNVRSLLPLAALGLLVLLAVFYRQPVYVLITGTATLLTLLIAFNINQALGYSFNVLSASLPVLVMTITVADSIHIIKRWQIIIAEVPAQQVKANPLPFLITCWQQTWRPCLFTSITSAAGFGVFYFSELIPLSHFGLVAFTTLLLAWISIMLTTLLMFYSFRPTASAAGLKLNIKIPVTDWVANKRGWIINGAFGLLIMFLASLPLAQSETNFLEVFFNQQSTTRQTFNLVDAQLSGSGSVDIIIQGESPDTFRQLSFFEQLQAQADALGALAEVRIVSSLLEPVEMVHAPLGGEGLLPASEAALEQELLFLEFSRGDNNLDVLSDFVDFDYHNSRLSLYTKNMRSSETESLLADIKPILDRLPVGYLLTGANVYFNELSTYVLDAQRTSILMTSLLVWLIFLIQFGIRIGTIGTAVSLLPIATTTSLQIISGVPFDFSTVMVASVAMGLAIDNSIHYLHRFRNHQATGMGAQSLAGATADVWQPVLMTTFILIAGFLLLTQSELVVIDRFSILLSLSLLLSLPATFLLLPALLDRFALSRQLK